MSHIDYNYIKDKLKKFNLIKEILDNNIFINWFFVPKPHPLYIDRYTIFNKSFFYIFLLLIKNLFKILTLFFAKIFEKKINYNQFEETDFDYVLISHHISNNKIFEEDIYYKNITNILKNKKKKYFTIYLNHKINLNKNILENKKNYYFLSNGLSIAEEMNCYAHIFKLFKFYLNIKGFSFKEKLIILTQVLNSETLANVRINLQVKKIFKKINFKFLISTFEGFNFEKIIYNLAKSKDSKIQNIGYQYTSILKDQDSLFDFQKTDYYPDIIFTSGDYYKKIFEKYTFNKSIFIAGSNKLNQKILINKNKENFCLVIPEAILSECKLLFQFTIEYTKRYDNLNFIWRLHPLMKIDNVLNQLRINKKDLNNIYFSDNSDEDFIKSKYCLYRGSTAIIQGLKNLCYPVYLNSNLGININPIYDIKEIENINSIDGLNLVVNKHKKDLNEIEIDYKISQYFNVPSQKLIDLL